MEHEHHDIKEKILNHLDGLNKLERQQGSQALIDTIARRYDVPRNVVEQTIAEWGAGGEKVEGKMEFFSPEPGPGDE